MGRLYLVRHGETRWNAERRLQGQLDSPLTPRGIEQAEAVAARLCTCRLTHLYSSDLGRAVQTARAVSEATGLEITPLAVLRERHFGLLEGLSGTEAQLLHPATLGHLDADPVSFRVPGGESYLDLRRRAGEAFDWLVTRHSGDRLAVITHGGLLKALTRHLRGEPPGSQSEIVIENASVTVVALARHSSSLESCQLETLGDTSHLETG